MLFGFDLAEFKRFAPWIGIAIFGIIIGGFRAIQNFQSGEAFGERLRKEHPTLGRILGVVLLLLVIAAIVFINMN